MTASEKYVAAAYLVVFAVVLAWLLIISTKLARLQRDVGELADRMLEDRRSHED